MKVQLLLGCGALARRLGVTETRVRQMKIPPDALVDGRSAWTEETAERVRAQREARRLHRGSQVAA